MDKVKEYIIQEQNRVKQVSDDYKEVVSDYEAIRAYAILSLIEYKNIMDLYIGAVCLNLLNCYVKQPKSRIGYMFKLKVLDLMEGVKKVNSQDINVFSGMDGKINVTYIQFYNEVQFSYHGVQQTELIKQLSDQHVSEYGEIVWDHIGKQKVASTLFNNMLENISYSSNKALEFKMDALIIRMYKPFINGVFMSNKEKKKLQKELSLAN